MIKVVEKKKKNKKQNPYYELIYNYMIGDGKGNTTEEVIVSVNNPFVERYVKLLNSLQPTKNHWGIVFERNRIYESYQEGQITKDDYLFLERMMKEDYDEDYDEDDEEEDIFIVSKADEDYASEFYEGVRGQTEYSFLVFEGVELYYYDEYGVKHETEIID
jgi:hypothetical protein